MSAALKKELQERQNVGRARVLARFFKTGPGHYGEGDRFLGVTVPEQRKVAQKYISLPLLELAPLLEDPFHECRLTALLVLVEKYKKANLNDKKPIVDFYLRHTEAVNNWDLVDLTADKILGDYLVDKDKSLLLKLAHSPNLWERRMAIIATFAFIKKNKFDWTFRIAERLLSDKQDLIHKAVGWMLREIGKRHQQQEEEFLLKYYKSMPRTMLRYAVERFGVEQKKFYLHSNDIP